MVEKLASFLGEQIGCYVGAVFGSAKIGKTLGRYLGRGLWSPSRLLCELILDMFVSTLMDQIAKDGITDRELEQLIKLIVDHIVRMIVEYYQLGICP